MASNLTIEWGAIKGILQAIALTLGVYVSYVALNEIDWEFVTGNVTDYALKCGGVFENGICTGSYIQGPVTVYTINANQQFVISQVTGEPPTKLTKCAIVSRRNWKCSPEGGDKYVSISYTDGVISDLLPGQAYKHVSRSEWLRAPKE